MKAIVNNRTASADTLFPQCHLAPDFTRRKSQRVDVCVPLSCQQIGGLGWVQGDLAFHGVRHWTATVDGHARTRIGSGRAVKMSGNRVAREPGKRQLPAQQQRFSVQHGIHPATGRTERSGYRWHLRLAGKCRAESCELRLGRLHGGASGIRWGGWGDSSGCWTRTSRTLPIDRWMCDWASQNHSRISASCDLDHPHGRSYLD